MPSGVAGGIYVDLTRWRQHDEGKGSAKGGSRGPTSPWPGDTGMEIWGGRVGFGVTREYNDKPKGGPSELTYVKVRNQKHETVSFTIQVQNPQFLVANMPPLRLSNLPHTIPSTCQQQQGASEQRLQTRHRGGTCIVRQEAPHSSQPVYRTS